MYICTVKQVHMKRFTTLLFACLSSLALLSCEKIGPVDISQTQKEEKKQSEENNNNSNNNDQIANMVIDITAGGRTITATLTDNATAKELAGKLKAGAITVQMKANGFEHYGPLGFSLTSHNEQVTAVSGDIMLYNSNNICVFYGNNSWSYTPLGKVDGFSADELKAFFGTGDISVTYSINNAL